jgi:hypothetical protein
MLVAFLRGSDVFFVLLVLEFALKYRAIAIRNDKTARKFLAAIHLTGPSRAGMLQN